MTETEPASEVGRCLAVVAVAYRSARTIEACLDSLADLPGVQEVVVVDHGDDDTSFLARAMGALVIEDPTNPGFGAGQNRGLAATSAPWVLLLNPDAEVIADGVMAGLEHLLAHPRVALVQGAILGSEQTPERSQGRELGPLHLWGRALHLRGLLRLSLVSQFVRRIPALADHVDRVPVGPHDVECLAATALLARREAIESIGGFDEQHYFLYGEDLDLCRRLRNAGWRLVALPNRWAVHLGGASAESSWQREFFWWEGTMTFAARWWGPLSFAVALVASAVRGIGLLAARPRSWRAVVSATVGDPLRTRRSRH